MNFRFKEIIRYIVPGLYIILQVLGYFSIINFDSVLTFLKEQKDTGFVTFVLFLVPVVAYIIGYFIEIGASALEYNLYRFELIKRPSYIILNNKSKRYIISSLEALYIKIGAKKEQIENNTNAKDVFDIANQNINNRSCCEEFFYQMIVARNMFTAQVIIFTVIFIFKCIGMVSLWIFLISIIIVVILYYRWWQISMSYTKHVLLQFLNEKEDASL